MYVVCRGCRRRKTWACPLCGKYHPTVWAQHKCYGVALSGLTPVRSPRFFNITAWADQDAVESKLTPKMVLDLYQDGIEPERATVITYKLADYLKHALYAYDPARGMAIVQLRMGTLARKRHFMRMWKSYFLLWHDKWGLVHQQPLSYNPVRRAARTGSDVIQAAQMWMWSLKPNQLAEGVAIGDQFLFPTSPPPDSIDPVPWSDTSTHYSMNGVSQAMASPAGVVVQADCFVVHDGRIYAQNPKVTGHRLAMDWAIVLQARNIDVHDFKVKTDGN